jgi:uncharacterized protein
VTVPGAPAADAPHFPGRAAIEAYGDGGFRFAGMSHRGSLLIVPSGMYAWPPAGPEALVPESFARVLAEASGIGVFLFGTGAQQVFPLKSLRQAFQAAGLTIEAMDTGAAVRTYNVLLAEARPVAAALIAVG